MKKRFTYLTLLFVLFTAFTFGQKNKYTLKVMSPEKLEVAEGVSNTNNSVSLKSLFKAIDGTYQIQISDENYKMLLSQSLYNKIVLNRKNDVDVSLSLDDKSTLFLPAYNNVKESSFKKLKKSIYLNK
jgi:hypothetical protein